MEIHLSRQLLSIFVFAIVYAKNIISLASSKYTCEVRFEIAATMKRGDPCDMWLKKNPICKEDIRIAYTDHPPYVYAGINQSVQGILPAMLRRVFDICCLGCTNLTFIGPMDYTKRFNIYNPGASIMMPVETSKTSSKFFSLDYVYFLEVPGVSFFLPEQKPDAAELTANLFHSVLSTWPLFVTALVMAIIAGIVIWLMDTWVNAEHFPRSFVKGPFEGFWWAFVSMTTVGYGDKAPKSYLARFFAIIWIFLGITIFSMYTATLTTALTMRVVTSKVSVSGKKIAVDKTTSAVYSGALKETAIVKGYKSIDEIINALKREEVEGAGLDDNIANFYSEKLKKNFKGYDFIKRVPIAGTAYGIAMRDKSLPKGALKHFFTTFFENNEDQREAIIAGAMSKIRKIDTTATDNGDTSVFSYKSPIFVTTSLSLLGIGGTLILVGLVIQYALYMRRGNKKGNSDDKVKLMHDNSDALETDFLDEAKELCQRWRKKYEEIRNELKPVAV